MSHLFPQSIEINTTRTSSDLGFWYSNSFGSPVSASMGTGWVQELVSRLTKTPISVHNSTTNGTLNNNPETFPLDQPIYVDATHDTIISTSKPVCSSQLGIIAYGSSVIVALNFTGFAAGGPLPTDRIPRDRVGYSPLQESEIPPILNLSLSGRLLSLTKFLLFHQISLAKLFRAQQLMYRPIFDLFSMTP